MARQAYANVSLLPLFLDTQHTLPYTAATKKQALIKSNKHDTRYDDL
jgi:hypothetical protein